MLVLAAGPIAGQEFGPAAVGALACLGLVGTAFAHALGGMLLALLARGAYDSARLLLADVVVGVMLSALGDLVHCAAARQYLLGNTGFVGCATLAAGLAATLPLAWRLAGVLDVLALGDGTAASLGLALSQARAVRVATLALAAGCAVSQTCLVALVGLVAPHLVRRLAPSTAAWTLLAGSAAGSVLLFVADVASRRVLALRELSVGMLTAAIGGGHLRWLPRHGAAA